MRLFDLHCDTVTECRNRGLHMRDNPLHLDFARAEALDAWAQVFAIWIPDDLRGDAAWRYYEENYAFFLRETADSAVRFCRSADDLEAAVCDNAPMAVLSVEGGAVLGGDPVRLERLYAMGIRMMTLTWNGENELGFGCQASGGGLKPFGRDVVSEMQALGMIVDVSHINPQGFWDVMDMTDRPVIASHSTCASVLRHTRKCSADRDFSVRRALEDDQIRILAQRGGLIGLNLCGSFLGDPGEDGMPAALLHARHILAVGGEDVLAIGSDFDGCTIHPSMAGIEMMPGLYAFFVQNGVPETVCEKIFFRNAWNFMKSML